MKISKVSPWCQAQIDRIEASIWIDEVSVAVLTSTVFIPAPRLLDEWAGEAGQALVSAGPLVSVPSRSTAVPPCSTRNTFYLIAFPVPVFQGCKKGYRKLCR